MTNKSTAKLGPPALAFAELSIWIHGRQFPDSHDYWDGNWLRATACCDDAGANVVVTGSIIHLSELDRWLAETERLLQKLDGEAKLACLEPAISVVLRAASLGHVVMEVSITPDHMNQRHWYRSEMDQSYLPPLVQQLRRILQAYPIRGR